MSESDMKHFETASDEDGRLYVPWVRKTMSDRLPEDALPAVEAFSAFKAASRMLELGFDRWCGTENLSSTRLGVLFMLHHIGRDLPLGSLANRLRVSPRNVTGLVDHLERDGLVRRVPDPSDRRTILAQLTDLGRERMDELWRKGVALQRLFFADFTPEELVQLRHLCLKLAVRAEELDKSESLVS